MEPLIQANFDYSMDAVGVIRGVHKYRKDIAEDAGRLAAKVMRQGMATVPPGSPSSRPGQFPNAISGGIKEDIDWAVDGESVIVGPSAKLPPAGYSIGGAATIAEALNVGATITIRKKQTRNRKGRYQRVRTVRFTIRPRPYVDLTLEVVSRHMADIASKTPLSKR